MVLGFFILNNFSSSSTIMNLNEIKPGMIGIGKTVLQGDKIEEFEIEILGVLKNFAPDKNLILGKLKGLKFEKTGVIAGMSGSPVYIDGKVIGAIAYHFPFSKEAIAGITPIKEMIDISGKKSVEKSATSNSIPIKKILTLEELFKINEPLFSNIYSLNNSNQMITLVTTPLVFSGFSPGMVEKYKSFFTRLGFQPVRGGIAQKSPLTGFSLKDIRLEEGAPVAVQLITGDFDLSAVGTVTYVDGNKVLAFGHPLYNLGEVDYSMAKAEIITVIPSLQSSFKLANTGELVGKFTQDRLSGLLGEIGRMPTLIPLNIEIIKSEQDRKTFNLKFINDKILSPFLVNLALSNAVVNEGREYGDLSLKITGNIYLENGKSVHLEDLFSGNFNSSIQEFSGLFTAVVYFLANNQFKNLKIHKIDIEILCQEKLNVAYLEKVWVNKFEGKPGEKIQIKIFSRTSRGKIMENEVGLTVPYLPVGSSFNILIGDASSLYQMEIAQYRRRYFMPRSLDQLIRILNNLRKNNRIYFKLFTNKPGIFLKGEEMPNLPPSIQTMLVSPRASSSSPSITNFSTLREYQLPVQFVFNGSVIIPIKIKE